ncbi:hypothetical protein [Micromonospora mirobrigensis]|uniref:Uncharacterized protein n=1 Tax=Micromonospora mirobrigensis TaxID=262898 RepID=A0A1C4U8G9_9ACTN|nr:hypothetical protein GA0070564_101297 [Micromonospora mirobrigensis]
MRFVRALAGLLLLIIGIPALLAGGTLAVVARHADPGGSFGARFEQVHTDGQAVVVPDLDALLHTEAPFARTDRSRVRLTAGTADGPAFLGLAPTEEVRRWLGPVPHATITRVTPARGPLPVRLAPAGPPMGAPSAAGAGTPVSSTIWVREGIGALEWSPADLAGPPLSLVVMRPDGRADLTLDLRAELRAGWFGPVTYGLLGVGILLVAIAALVLLRPIRPREVIFVVEPDQVPVLAGRLGVSSLSGLASVPGWEPPPVRERELVGVGAGGARSTLGAVAPGRPASLADLPPAGTAEGAAPPATRLAPPDVALDLTWPPAGAEEPRRPASVPATLRPAAPDGGAPTEDRS